jgi:hypothetical protein
MYIFRLFTYKVVRLEPRLLTAPRHVLASQAALIPYRSNGNAGVALLPCPTYLGAIAKAYLYKSG